MNGPKSPWGKMVVILLAWSLTFMAWNVFAIDRAFAGEGGSSEKAAEVDEAKKSEKEAAEKAAEEEAAKEREASEKAAKEREAAEKAAQEREAAEKDAQKEKESAASEKSADAGRGDEASSEGSAEPQDGDGKNENRAAQSEKSESKEAAAKSKEAEKSGKSADKSRKSGKRDDKADEDAKAGKKRNENGGKGSKKEKRVTYPAAVFGGGANGVSVSVHAPSGALPKGSKLIVSGASAGLSRGDVRPGSSDVVVTAKAVAISFKGKDGKGVSPKKSVRIGLSGVFAETDQELHAIDLATGGDVASASSGAGFAFFESSHPSSYALVVTKSAKSGDEQGQAEKSGVAERTAPEKTDNAPVAEDAIGAKDVKGTVADMTTLGLTARFTGMNGIFRGALGPNDATLSITASDGRGVYNGEPFGLDNVTASVDSAIIEYKVGNGDWSTDAPTVTNVADSQNRTISVRARADGYNPAQVDGLSIVVERKAATVTADSFTKKHGTRDPKLTASLSGLVGSDTIAYDLRRDPGEDVGAYEIVAFGEAEQGNYDVSYKSGTLTIVDASGHMKVTGVADATYSGRAQTPAVKVADAETGLILSAGKDYSVAYSGNVNAGKGTVTVKGVSDYEGDVVTSTFVIKPAPLAVVTASATKPYDGKPLTAPGRLKGLVNKEKATLKVTGSQKRMGKSKNTYKIIWNKTAVKTNYTVATERLGKLIVGLPLPTIISRKVSSHTLLSPGVPLSVAMPSFGDLPSSGKTLPDVPDVTANDYVPDVNDEPAAGASENTTSAFTGSTIEGGWSLFDAIALVVSLVAAALALAGTARFRNRQNHAALPADQQQISAGKTGIVCVVLGVVVAALFIATQNLALPMILFDAWSVLFGIIGAACVALAVLARGKAQDAASNGGGTRTAA